MRWVRWFQEIDQDAAPSVGAKNAALGEVARHLAPAGVRVPDGFALVIEAYREFVRSNGLAEPLREALSGLAVAGLQEIARRSARARELVLGATIPDEIAREVVDAYAFLSRGVVDPVDPEGRAWVAVRSSGPEHEEQGRSGRRDSFLYIHGDDGLLERVRRCWASQFHPSAIAHRVGLGLDAWDAAVSVGVQRLVSADRGCTGSVLTADPATGDRELMVVTSTWGLDRSLVRSRDGPDSFWVHKEALRRRRGRSPIVVRRTGSKPYQVVWDDEVRELIPVTPSAEDRARLSLEDGQVLALARWAVAIEDHWTRLVGQPTPVEVEWATDGHTGEAWVLQVRPQAVGRRARPAPEEERPNGERREAVRLACTALVDAARRAPRAASVVRSPDRQGFTTLVVDPGLDAVGASADALLHVVRDLAGREAS